MIAPVKNPLQPRQPEPEPLRLLIRPPEAADALGISLRNLMTLVERGEIPHVRIGARNLRFSVDQLREWIAEKSSRQSAPAVEERRQQ